MSGTRDLSEVLEFGRALISHYLEQLAARRPGGAASAFAVSAAEVARTLGPAPVGAAAASAPAAAVARVEQARAALAERVRTQPTWPLALLGRITSLTELDLALVAVLLAPELDVDLERAYAYALDDFTKKRPDVGFLARLFGDDDERAEAVLRRLGEDGPLRRHRLVTISGDGPWISRVVRLADRIAAFARGLDPIDEQVVDVCRVRRGAVGVGDLVMAPTIVERVTRALDQGGALGGARLLLAGQPGTGRALLVEALAAARGQAAVRIDLVALAADPRQLADRLTVAVREAALRGAVAILDGDADIGDNAPRLLIDAIGAVAGATTAPMVFTLVGRPSWLSGVLPELVEIEVPAPGLIDRIALWKLALPDELRPPEAELEMVAGRYAFTGAAIAQAARRAVNAARVRAPGTAVTLAELSDASRLMFTHRLGSVAQRIPAGFTWEDLVLPEETLLAVREVVRFARQRPFLLEQWGFARKLPYGRGVSAILAGPPGTGKTMVAQLLAAELGYDLYRIDLSQVVNKYIGETEKNLSRIFDQAESSHAVLFFDEADSLFAKRTEVKSSNDRYANLEVNYLLQRMETYDGVTLLATNLEQGIDEAFKRRVRFSVQFELPELEERGRLWRSMFPAEMPLAPDIDWARIAKTFEMSGGYIKKAAVRAALIAADAQPRRPLTTDDILAAARAEYREMGRIVAG
jgi:ATP-dependent 26S proteasome regulatory subunit